MLSWFKDLPESTSAKALYKEIETLEHHVPIYRGTVDVTSDEECAQVVSLCNNMEIDGELTYMWIISDSTHATKGGKVTLSNSWRDLLDKKEECGASIGDVLIGFIWPHERTFKIISIYEAEAASGDYCGNEGLMSVWDKTQVNKIPSLEYIWNYLFQSRYETNANKCIYSGTYPYVTTNIPTGQWGTIQAIATKDKDNNGYYTVTQFFYYRGTDNSIDTVWTRFICYKDDGAVSPWGWKALSNGAKSFVLVRATGDSSTISVDGVDTYIPEGVTQKINFSSSLDFTAGGNPSCMTASIYLNDYLPLENFTFTKASPGDYPNGVYLRKIDANLLDTTNTTNFQALFLGQAKLVELDLSFWDVGECALDSIFDYCYNLTTIKFGPGWGTHRNSAFELNLRHCGENNSFQLNRITYDTMLTMYDRASAGYSAGIITFNKKHNLPEGFVNAMTSKGYTITLT